MITFISSFISLIDNKNRITIPANFKNSIKESKQESIYLFRSLKNNCLEIYLRDQIQSIITSLTEEDFFSKKKDHVRTAILSDLEEIKIDKEGRFVLKEDHKKFCKIQKEIIFIGKGRYFEIWDKLKGNRHKVESRKKLQ